MGALRINYMSVVRMSLLLKSVLRQPFSPIGLVEARQMGFFINPGVNLILDDQTPGVLQYQHLQDFTAYGAETRGAQRARRNDDPHVVFEPPAQDFMDREDVRWILREAEQIDDQADFYGTDKYLLVLNLIDQLQRRS